MPSNLRVGNRGTKDASEYSDSQYSSIKFTLTSAQILALNTTPISLVGGYGSTTFLEAISCVIRLNYVTTTYTHIGNLLIMPSVANFNGQLLSSNALTGTTTRIVKLIATAVPAVGVSNVETNQNLYIGASGANPTLGDGTLNGWLHYRAVTF